MAAWVRQVLPGSRWLDKAYSYRLDVQGYAWLNLDAIDGHRGQRPGVPYKAFASTSTFYPRSLVWEVEGSETDSANRASSIRRTRSWRSRRLMAAACRAQHGAPKA